MTAAARERQRIRRPLAIAAALAWLLLVSRSLGNGEHVDHQGTTNIAVDWTLMLTAMMLPLLAAPLRHVRDRSLKRRRARSIALFLIGYAAAWVAATILVVPLMVSTERIARSSWLATLGGLLAIAAWECSPAKQRCLNRGHKHPALGLTSSQADRDAVNFGVTHGFWCLGSCAPLMMVSALLPHAHVPAMMAVSVWIAAERIETPARPSWRIRFPRKALGLAIAASHQAARAVSTHIRLSVAQVAR